MARYVVAVRRERKIAGVTTVGIGQIPGVQLMGGDAARVIVEASPAGIAELNRRFSADLHVEPMIAHHTG